MAQVAYISIHKGPAVIKSENAKRTVWIYVDLKNIDVGTYVKRAKQIVYNEVKIPAGYSLVWSGQFEYMERTNKRLRLVVPITILIIFLLLYFHFKNLTESLMVMLSLPFALVGGVWLMFISGYNMSVALAVGLIALAGLAAETGVVMLVYLDEAFARYKTEGRMNNWENLKQAISEGAV